MINNITLDKFEFIPPVWPDQPVSMEWVEKSQDHYGSGYDMDIDINKDDAEKLITFLADSLNISLRDLAHRNGR